MGLMQRQRQVYSTAQPLYNLAGDKTYLLVGLGNEGKKFIGSRHNAGFMCINDFAERNEFPEFTLNKDLKCHISTMKLGQAKVILIKPVTMMNLSGQAVQAVQNYFKIDNGSIAVVYDELAIRFGQIRMRVGGESAGHNGIKSIIEHSGEDFGRIRVGINNTDAKKIDSADFVLKKFSKTEQIRLIELNREVSAILTEYVFSGELPHDTRSIA